MTTTTTATATTSTARGLISSRLRYCDGAISLGFISGDSFETIKTIIEKDIERLQGLVSDAPDMRPDKLQERVVTEMFTLCRNIERGTRCLRNQHATDLVMHYYCEYVVLTLAEIARLAMSAEIDSAVVDMIDLIASRAIGLAASAAMQLPDSVLVDYTVLETLAITGTQDRLAPSTMDEEQLFFVVPLIKVGAEA